MKVKHAERRKKPSESGSDLEDYSGMDCLVTSLPVKGKKLDVNGPEEYCLIGVSFTAEKLRFISPRGYFHILAHNKLPFNYMSVNMTQTYSHC